MIIEALTVLIIFSAGATLGSFLNVVILRYQTGETLGGRSHCVHCKETLRWQELMPIASFILLRGQCSSCRGSISAQYPVVEFITGICALIFFFPLPYTSLEWLTAALAMCIVSFLLILCWIDMATLTLPDHFIGYLTVAVAAYILVTGLGNVVDRGLGILVGAGFLALLWVITKGQGIGLGDVKLLIPLGALAGMLGSIFILYVAFTAGGLVGVFLLWQRKVNLKTALPFGPFLIGAALIYLIAPQLPAHLLTYIYF